MAFRSCWPTALKPKIPFPPLPSITSRPGILVADTSCSIVAITSRLCQSWPTILDPQPGPREGFAAAASEAGALKECKFYDFSLDPEEIRLATLEVLRGIDRPRAIFAASNIAGKGIIPAIQDQGLRIPGDVALLVMDDFEA